MEIIFCIEYLALVSLPVVLSLLSVCIYWERRFQGSVVAGAGDCHCEREMAFWCCGLTGDVHACSLPGAVQDLAEGCTAGESLLEMSPEWRNWGNPLP